MVGRFIRFYGVSDVEVLRMPARRFFVLHDKIVQLTAEEDLREFMNQHGKPQERQKELSRLASGGKAPVSATTNKPALAIINESPAVASQAVPGEVSEIRRIQREAAERLKAEWLAKQNQSS